jgi:phosphoribosylglycinamide formyltransferase-1
MLRIGVLVSGGGTNLQAIIDRIEDGFLKNCEIAAVVSSREDAFALERAKKHDIPAACIRKQSFGSVDEYDKAMIEHFARYNVGLIVLAGFLSKIGDGFVREYKNRIINIHPSLIPSFCGKGFYGIIPHKKALEYGVKITGATVHFVDTEYDQGPIIMQRAVRVMEGDTPEMLQKRVMEEAEWKILPEAIKLFSQGRLEVCGRRVRIKECGAC